MNSGRAKSRGGKQTVPPQQHPRCFRVMADFLGHFYVCDPATAATQIYPTTHTKNECAARQDAENEVEILCADPENHT